MEHNDFNMFDSKENKRKDSNYSQYTDMDYIVSLGTWIMISIV